MRNKVFIVCLLSLVPCCFAMKHSKTRYTEPQRARLTELSQTAGFDKLKTLIGQLSSPIKNEETFLTLLENATTISENLKLFADARESDEVTDSQVNETLYRQALSYLTNFIGIYSTLETRIRKISTDSTIEQKRTHAADIIMRVGALRDL